MPDIKEKIPLLGRWGNLLDGIPDKEQQEIKACFDEIGKKITADNRAVRKMLLLAIEKEYVEVFQYFLEKGANLFELGEYPDDFIVGSNWVLSAVIKTAAEQRNSDILKIIVESLIAKNQEDPDANFYDFLRRVLIKTKNVVLGLSEEATREQRARVRNGTFVADENVKNIEKLINAGLQSLESQKEKLEEEAQNSRCVIS